MYLLLNLRNLATYPELLDMTQSLKFYFLKEIVALRYRKF